MGLGNCQGNHDWQPRESGIEFGEMICVRCDQLYLPSALPEVFSTAAEPLKSFAEAVNGAMCGGCDDETDVCTCRYEWVCPGCGKKVEAVGEEIPDFEEYSEGGHCGRCMVELFSGE